MRRISILVTILITSFVMALSGLAASSVATASENETVTSSFSIPTGSSVLTKSQKAAIKKVVATAGTDATFLVTAAAGKLPGASDSGAQLLAKKRGQVVKAYLVKLGVSKSSVTTKVKITRLGIVPKTKIVGSYAAQTPTSTTPAPAAPVVALTCAAGGTCVVGDRGPGGGIVYYVSSANFTSTGSNCGAACKYLEVAPATWKTGTVANDATYQWSTNTTVLTGQDVTTASTEGVAANSSIEKINWKIGQGFRNTSLMNVGGGPISAAKTAVLAYAGNSTAGQWFIPSMNELNELCKYARGQSTGVLTARCSTSGALKTGTANDLGGFMGSDYWSSSELNAAGAWYQGFYNAPGSGDQLSIGKHYATYVRPIRAF